MTRGGEERKLTGREFCEQHSLVRLLISSPPSSYREWPINELNLSIELERLYTRGMATARSFFPKISTPASRTGEVHRPRVSSQRSASRLLESGFIRP